MPSILLFASGSGTNAQNIVEYFGKSSETTIEGLVCNVPGAGVINRMQHLKVPVKMIQKAETKSNGELQTYLKEVNPDLIVLAGYLWLIPKWMVQSYPNRILNVHPALLPKYGGKGMYGMHVHRAVKENNETETGISIHYVNEQYDEGATIFQASCALDPTDSPEDIAAKIHKLEHAHFPQVIEKLLNQNSAS